MSLDILQTILAGDVQEEQRNSVVAPIIQERRCIQHCGYLKGIKVLSLTMKIWERVFYRRGLEEEDKRRSSAVWFHMPIRWITHAVFAGTQLIENNCEMQKEPCIHGEKLEVYERTGCA